MLVKRRTKRRIWALLSVFGLTFVIMIAGASALGTMKTALKWWFFW